MKKFVILLFLMPLLGYSQSFKITANAPQQIKANSSVIVSITLNKSDFTGFGIFQVHYPTALTYTNLLTKGIAKKIIDTNSRMIKLYWASMPTDEKVNVILYFKTKKLKNNFSVKYWFDYQANNMRGFIKGIAVKYEVKNNIATKVAISPATQQTQATADSSITEIQNFFED